MCFNINKRRRDYLDAPDIASATVAKSPRLFEPSGSHQQSWSKSIIRTPLVSRSLNNSGVESERNGPSKVKFRPASCGSHHVSSTRADPHADMGPPDGHDIAVMTGEPKASLSAADAMLPHEVNEDGSVEALIWPRQACCIGDEAFDCTIDCSLESSLNLPGNWDPLFDEPIGNSSSRIVVPGSFRNARESMVRYTDADAATRGPVVSANQYLVDPDAGFVDVLAPQAVSAPSPRPVVSRGLGSYQNPRNSTGPRTGIDAAATEAPTALTIPSPAIPAGFVADSQAPLDIPVPTPSPFEPPHPDDLGAGTGGGTMDIEMALKNTVDGQVFRRKRPPCDWNPQFWNKLTKICSRYPLATADRPLPILSTNFDGQIRIRNRLANHLAASTRTVDFVDGMWEQHIKRFGALNPLQEEERKLCDHSHYALSHLPRAIACGDISTKRKVAELMRQHSRYVDMLCDEECKARHEAEIRVLHESGSI